MKKLREAIKQRMLFTKILFYILIKLKIVNNRIASLTFRNVAMNKIRKKYSKFIENRENTSMTRKYSNIIWFCWLQGIEKAPDLVKRCYESVVKYNSDMKVVVIDSINYKNYVDIPDFIIKKWQNGIITNTHFSDILRLELLIKYGGVWADSTCYFTDSIPKWVKDLDMFLFTEHSWGDITVNIGSWFISSKSNSQILILTRDLLYDYHKKYDVLLDYFLLHLFFKLSSEKYEEEFKKIPVFLQDNCHILSREFFTKFNKSRFNDIKKLSFVHKLTNKFTIPKNINNTYYEKFLNNELK